MFFRKLDSIEDFNELVENEVVEDLHLEYKEKFPDCNNKKEEFLKDVSALANASGGNIIYGLREEDGVASKIVGVELADNKDDFKTRLGNLIDDTIKPAIKYHIDLIELDQKNLNKFLVILKVYESFQKPHQIRIKKNQFFYIRHDSRNVPMEIEELKQSFLRSDTLAQSSDQFRSDSVQKLCKGQSPYPSAPTSDMNKLIMHIFPVNSFYSNRYVSPDTIKDTLSTESTIFADSDPLIKHKSIHCIENFHGVLNYGDDYFYTQFYRDGKIEFVDMYLFNNLFKHLGPNNWIQTDRLNHESYKSYQLEDKIVLHILRFSKFLKKWNFEAPLFCYFSCVFPNGIRKRLDVLNKKLFTELGNQFLLPSLLFNQFPDSNSELKKELEPIFKILIGALSDSSYF